MILKSCSIKTNKFDGRFNIEQPSSTSKESERVNKIYIPPIPEARSQRASREHVQVQGVTFIAGAFRDMDAI